jgi:hypothetical protein
MVKEMTRQLIDPVERAKQLARLQTSTADIAAALAVEYDADSAIIAGIITKEKFANLLSQHRAYGQVQIRERVFAGMEDTSKHGNDLAQYLATQYLEMGRDPTDKRLIAIVNQLEKLRKSDPRKFAAMAEQLVESFSGAH